MQVRNVISNDFMMLRRLFPWGKYSDLLMVVMPIFEMMLTIIDIGRSMFLSGIFYDIRSDYQFGVRWGDVYPILPVFWYDTIFVRFMK